MAMRVLAVFFWALALVAGREHGYGNAYDFIIIGGGTSGLVVANRLTEDPNVTVLVVEYGYLDNNFTTLIPYYANFNNLRDLFNITSTPLVNVNNKPFVVNAAATVGGGSVANGMYFDRASAVDYDAWEMLGNSGWGWKSLLPYFKKSTTFTAPKPEAASKYGYTWESEAWGREGPIYASIPPFQWPELQHFWRAFGETGGATFPEDGGDGSGVGVYWVPSSQNPSTQTRSDARTAYYNPVQHRSNLDLVTGTKANKILFDHKTAIGIEMTSRKTNVTSSAFASKEVILAAGPIFSTHILHLSGIGPRSMLEQAGMDVVHDLPGVGMNFQDHPTALLTWNFTTDTYPNPDLLKTNATFNEIAEKEYYKNRTGPWIQAHGNSGAFLPLRTIAPDMVDGLLSNVTTQDSSSYLPSIYDATTRHGYSVQHQILLSSLNSTNSAIYEFPFQGSGQAPNVLLKPFSRGTITLNVSNPHGLPVVDYNTFSDPFDEAIILNMIAFTRKLFQTQSLSPLGPVETISGTDREVLEQLKQSGLMMPSFAHPCGSNAMMPLELGGVVSPELEVYGIERLRVVDSSIIPLVPGTHLCGTVYAIAEKAADLIKARHSCR